MAGLAWLVARTGAESAEKTSRSARRIHALWRVSPQIGEELFLTQPSFNPPLFVVFAKRRIFDHPTDPDFGPPQGLTILIGEPRHVQAKSLCLQRIHRRVRRRPQPEP